MSSTSKTTNLELSQFLGVDKPSILGDYNGDMLKIDNAYSEVIGKIGDGVLTAENQLAMINANIEAINAIIERLNAKDVNDAEHDRKIELVNELYSVLNTTFERTRIDYDNMRDIIGQTYDGVLSVGETMVTLNTPNLTENSTIDVYTDKYNVLPTNIEVDEIDKTIKVTFLKQDEVLNIRVKVGA